MDLKLVYTFVPNQGSFEQLIEKKANRLARKIVLRTNHNMTLEDQAFDQERLKESIEELTHEIKVEVRRVLWD